MMLNCGCLQMLSFYVDIFWRISFMTWYLYHYVCKQTNNVIFISYAYHSRNIYLRYWWHLGSNHATCWPFSTRNRRATINKCKNTNLTVTPARAPQHMLTYVYLCPYLGFWPTSNHPRNCESQSNPPARFPIPLCGLCSTFHADSTAQERADLGVRF